MADSTPSEHRNSESSFPLSFQSVVRLLTSTETFPVDFDDAWQWIGYSSKQAAKKKLSRNFEKGVDYLSKWMNVSHSNGFSASQTEVISLTVDCFKSLAMMAGTARGRQVRRYFLDCEVELKRRLEQDRVVRVDFEQEYKAWQQRYDVRIYLKDFLRKELMDVVVKWATANGVSPIKLASEVHDTMNLRIQGMTSQQIKQTNKMSRQTLIRDHYDTPPLIDYSAINRVAKNAIVDRGFHPVQAVHEACDLCLGSGHEVKPVEIAENLYKQGRRLKAARKQRQLSQGKQLSFWDQQSEAC